jgi:ATP phosphoribosyltransferase regulatory subunit
VIHPLPSGTRDVLPDEMRELRAILDRLRAVFEEHGFGEVATPVLEYEEVLRRGGGGAEPGYRVVDDHGAVLTLRPDMTVPIARLAATRYAAEPPPLRFHYAAHVYRAVTPHRGQMREFLQAGIELLGRPGAEGTAEALTVLVQALEAVGLTTFRIALGDAGLFPALLERHGADAAARAAILRELGTDDLVGLEREVAAAGLPAELAEVPALRGGEEVLERAGDAAAGLRELHALLEPEIARRVILDLGLARGMGYYTGPIFDVLDPALGAPLGGGGRYDELLGRFGRDLPAVGFALGVERLHGALAWR